MTPSHVLQPILDALFPRYRSSQCRHQARFNFALKVRLWPKILCRLYGPECRHELDYGRSREENVGPFSTYSVEKLEILAVLNFMQE